MKIRNTKLAAWYSSIPRDAILDGVTTVFRNREGECFFDGPLAWLLTNHRVPVRFEMALDARAMNAAARLTYETPEGQQYFYTAMECESFASLWNDDPSTVTGLPTDCFEMSVGPGEAMLPTHDCDGTEALLRFDGSQFLLCAATPARVQNYIERLAA